MKDLSCKLDICFTCHDLDLIASFLSFTIYTLGFFITWLEKRCIDYGCSNGLSVCFSLNAAWCLFCLKSWKIDFWEDPFLVLFGIQLQQTSLIMLSNFCLLSCSGHRDGKESSIQSTMWCTHFKHCYSKLTGQSLSSTQSKDSWHPKRCIPVSFLLIQFSCTI